MVVAPTFEYYGLYVTGTTVFVGLCMALQAKVAFFHHQWAYPHLIAMFISVAGMFVYFLIIASVEDDYWNVAAMTYQQPIFWFFGFFSVPLFAIFIDWIEYFIQLFFRPTREMLYRELELQVCKIGSI